MLYAPIEETLAAFQRHSTSRSFEIEGIDYHYRTYQLERWDGTTPLLICLHGYKNNLHSFADLIPRLGRPAVTFDMRGFGRSRMPDAPFVGLVDHLSDLKRLLHHLGNPRVTLLGHSLGARLSGLWSALYPERIDRVIMIEGYYQIYPPTDWPIRFRRWLEQTELPLRPVPQVTPERLTAFFLRQTAGMSPVLARYLGEQSFTTLPDGTQVADWAACHQRPNPKPVDDRQMREALLSLTLPSLVLQSAPPYLGAEEIRLHNPHITLERLAGGHQLHWALPIELAERIRLWWDGRLEAPIGPGDAAHGTGSGFTP